MGTKEEDKEKYDLYTEKVVLHPAKKYKWLIRIGKVLLFAVSIMAAAIVFMVFLYPVLQKKIDEKNKDKNVVYIQKDNYIFAETKSGEYADTLTENDLKENYEAAMTTLRTKVESVKKCLVSVDIEKPVTDVPSVENSQTEVAGLIVAEFNSNYLILTSAELLKTAGNFTVKFSDDVQTDAAIICMDDSTGIGLISVSENKLTSEQRDSLSIAVLDNSYMVNQGDLVIAAGKLYETVKGVGYGTIAGIKTEYAFAILFNSEGKVVGISKSSSEASGKFMGISDLKGQLETMINHHGVMYCGITGQNVTDELTAKYNLPNGVYISNIDIDSPAYYAGLQAGDVISAINGQSILTIQQFSEKLYQCADGDTLLVTVKRQGKDGYSDVSFSVSVQLKQLN